MRNMFFFIVLILNSFGLPAQKTVKKNSKDSLIKILPATKTDTARVNDLNNISLMYKTQNPNKGIIYGNKALQLAMATHWKDGIATAYLNIGLNNYSLGNYDAALANYTLAVKGKISQSILSKVYLAIAAVNTSKTNYTKALEYCYKSLRISEITNNKIEIANAYNSIAGIYYYTNQTQKAIKYYNNALSINTQLNNKENISKNLEGLGICYYDIDENNKALTYFTKALDISIKTNNKESLAYLYFMMSNVFTDQDKTSQALKFIITAKKTAQNIGNNRILNVAMQTEAKIYVKMFLENKNSRNFRLLDKAEPLLISVVENAKKNSSLTNYATALKKLSELYSLKNEHKKAKEAYVLYVQLKDSIYNEESKESIQNLEDQRIIDLKNNEIKLNKITLDAKEKQKTFYILGLFLLAIIGSLLFFQSKNRQKTNQKLQVLNTNLNKANQTKAMFFGILNHDLRSPVYNLIHFLHLQKNNPELLDEQSKKEIQNQTLTAVENLLVSMEDMLLWSKGQMDNFKPQLKSVVINDVFNDIKNLFGSEQNLTLKFENPQNLEIDTDENYLQTIVRNLTSNAIKAMGSTAQPTINYSAYKKNDSIYITVTDNGKGASNTQFKALYDDSEVIGIKSGLGLHLIRDLAEAINCKITVHSKPNLGTTFELKFLMDINKHIA